MVALILGMLYLCWGSFLNSVGYRLLTERKSWRSQCPSCHHVLAWYDLIPLISFVIAGGVCRYCGISISRLYPLIEGITTVSLLILSYTVEPQYFIGGFILFSALIVSIRTDLSHMLISRWMTICLIPVGWLCALLDWIPIYPLSSLFGAAIGYCFLWIVGYVFYALTGKRGIGEGDYDLLAFIGSFIGVIGVWSTVLIGSIIGCIITIPYLWMRGTLRHSTPLPFGPFLAIGAMISFLYYSSLCAYLYCA